MTQASWYNSEMVRQPGSVILNKWRAERQVSNLNETRQNLTMQERARIGLDADFVAVAHHIEPVDAAQRRIGLTFRGTKGREVVIAEKGLRRVVHGLMVEF